MTSLIQRITALWLVAFAALCMATNHNPKSWRTTPQGDYGYFQDHDSRGDAIFLLPGNRQAVVARWRSPHGNKYRIWSDSQRLILPIRTRASFDSALVNFGNRAQRGRHWCEIVEDPWSDWVSEPVPTTCGLHLVTEARTCSTAGKADKPCADSCPEASQTRQVEHHNGACCDKIIFLAPDGSTPEEFAKTCPIGKKFFTTNCVGEERPHPCDAVPVFANVIWGCAWSLNGNCKHPRGNDTNTFRIGDTGDPLTLNVYFRKPHHWSIAWTVMTTNPHRQWPCDVVSWDGAECKPQGLHNRWRGEMGSFVIRANITHVPTGQSKLFSLGVEVHGRGR